MARSFPALVGLLTALVITTPAGGATHAPEERTRTARWAPGEVVVRFRPGVSRLEARGIHAELDAVTESRPDRGVELVQLSPETSVEEAVAAYRRDPLVEAAEPNWYRFPMAVPNDPEFAQQWSLLNSGQSHALGDGAGAANGTAGADIDASTAWDVETGDPGVVIAILDTGVDTGHPDIQASVWQNPSEVPGNGVDDDGNGFVDDANGWDVGENDSSLLGPSTAEGFDHGTHVAGIAAATRNNGTGIAGVCGGDGPGAPGCRVMTVKMTDDIDTNGDGVPEMVATMADEVAGLAYARQEGAQIVNISFGGPGWSAIERQAFVDAGAAGLLMVVASGNSGLDNDLSMAVSSAVSSPNYPSSYTVPQILAVTASNHHDEYGYGTACVLTGRSRARCSYASFGRQSVDVAAPGTDVLSTIPGGGYATYTGTSMASPTVAGLAGLVKSANPADSPLDVKNRIMSTVEIPAAVTTMHSYLDVLLRPKPAAAGLFTRSGGRVEADAALTGSTADMSPITDGQIEGALPLKKVRKGSVDWPEDTHDVYSKRLRRGKRYEVTLDGPRKADLDLYVFDPGTLEIWQFEEGCFTGRGPCSLRASSEGADGQEQVVFTAGRGTHFVQVTAFAQEGRYKLRIRRAPAKGR